MSLSSVTPKGWPRPPTLQLNYDLSAEAPGRDLTFYQRNGGKTIEVPPHGACVITGTRVDAEAGKVFVNFLRVACAEWAFPPEPAY